MDPSLCVSCTADTDDTSHRSVVPTLPDFPSVDVLVTDSVPIYVAP
jgi:hypothetical protein